MKALLKDMKNLNHFGKNIIQKKQNGTVFQLPDTKMSFSFTSIPS